MTCSVIAPMPVMFWMNSFIRFHLSLTIDLVNARSDALFGMHHAPRCREALDPEPFPSLLMTLSDKGF